MIEIASPAKYWRHKNQKIAPHRVFFIAVRRPRPDFVAD
jgi:hypothetical protein